MLNFKLILAIAVFMWLLFYNPSDSSNSANTAETFQVYAPLFPPILYDNHIYPTFSNASRHNPFTRYQVPYDVTRLVDLQNELSDPNNFRSHHRSLACHGGIEHFEGETCD